MGFKVRITDLYRHTGGQFFLFSQLKGCFLNHPGQHAGQKVCVCGIPVESMFRADGFLPVFIHDRSVVDTIGFFPQGNAILSQDPFQHFRRNLLQGFDGGYSHGAKQVPGFIPDHGDLPDGKRSQKWFDITGRDHQLSMGFGFSGSDLRDGFIDGETK